MLNCVAVIGDDVALNQALRGASEKTDVVVTNVRPGEEVPAGVCGVIGDLGAADVAMRMMETVGHWQEQLLSTLSEAIDCP